MCEILWVGARRCGGGWDDVGEGGTLWGSVRRCGGVRALRVCVSNVEVCETLWVGVRCCGLA